MPLLKATFFDRFMLLLGRRQLFKVEGDSMLPAFKSGDIVMIDPQAKGSVGDIVVAKHPYKKSVRLMKRVQQIDENGRYILKGDNSGSSTDSRSFGSVTASDVAGKVVGKYSG